MVFRTCQELCPKECFGGGAESGSGTCLFPSGSGRREGLPSDMIGFSWSDTRRRRERTPDPSGRWFTGSSERGYDSENKVRGRSPFLDRRRTLPAGKG